MRASELPANALVDLFNAGYSDYLLPMRFTADAFAEHIAANDIDLECSYVALDDEPAALALIGRRDGSGWVGGMGTAPRYRRRGLGEKALAAGLAALGERGANVAWLEVIDENGRAACAVRKARLRGGARPGRVVTAGERRGSADVPDDRRIERSRLDPRQSPGA